MALRLAGSCLPRSAAAGPRLDNSDLAEGSYIKHEKDGIVKGRYKWVRPGFIEQIAASDRHWRDRVAIRNRLLSPEC
jgi:hypothetical protein